MSKAWSLSSCLSFLHTMSYFSTPGVEFSLLKSFSPNCSILSESLKYALRRNVPFKILFLSEIYVAIIHIGSTRDFLISDYKSSTLSHWDQMIEYTYVGIMYTQYTQRWFSSKWEFPWVSSWDHLRLYEWFWKQNCRPSFVQNSLHLKNRWEVENPSVSKSPTWRQSYL